MHDVLKVYLLAMTGTALLILCIALILRLSNVFDVFHFPALFHVHVLSCDVEDNDVPLDERTHSDANEQNNANVQNDESRYPRRTNRGLVPKRYEHFVQSHEDKNCSTDYCYNLVCDVPVSYSDVVSCSDAPNWKEAMNDEMNSLLENNTWDLTPLPEGRPAVGGKWVYAMKHGQDGDVKFKARFVAKGYSQQADIDYHETFSPTAHITSVRMLQQQSVEHDLTVHQRM